MKLRDLAREFGLEEDALIAFAAKNYVLDLLPASELSSGVLKNLRTLRGRPPGHIRLDTIARELQVKSRTIVAALAETGMRASHSSWITARDEGWLRERYAGGNVVSSAPETALARRTIPCRNCGDPVREDRLAGHVKDRCAARSKTQDKRQLPRPVPSVNDPASGVKCPHCGAAVRADRLALHQKSRCPRLPAVCPGCGKTVAKSRLTTHKNRCLKKRTQTTTAHTAWHGYQNRGSYSYGDDRWAWDQTTPNTPKWRR